MEQSERRTVRVLEPVADPAELSGQLAARQADLQGKTVGLLDNGQINADIFLGRLGELLVEQHGAAGIVHRKKEFWTKQASGELVDELAASCDVVVTGWGS
ncbi:MAG: hypothetical protein HY329_14680 [Chloroflexi bacterium]|nr:hypothetical protein [Chloroflexota bacterium]